MSAGARWTLLIAMLAMAAGFAWAGASGLVPSPGGCYALAAICILISVAGLGGKYGPIAGRILGVCVFCACVGYLISEWPTKTLVYDGMFNRSHPSFFNALRAMIFFGIPGLVYAVSARWIGHIRLNR